MNGTGEAGRGVQALLLLRVGRHQDESMSGLKGSLPPAELWVALPVFLSVFVVTQRMAGDQYPGFQSTPGTNSTEGQQRVVKCELGASFIFYSGISASLSCPSQRSRFPGAQGSSYPDHQRGRDLRASLWDGAGTASGTVFCHWLGRRGRRAERGRVPAAPGGPQSRRRRESQRPSANAPAMREIVHIQAGQCGNQIGTKVGPGVRSAPAGGQLMSVSKDPCLASPCQV